MIAVILAAGRGSRLESYTDNLPKSLLTLNDDRTILDYNIKLLRDLGVKKQIIVTGYESSKIEQHVQDEDDIQCIYNPFWDKCNVLGSLYMALPFIGDDFLFLHADTVVSDSAWQKMLEKEDDIVLPYQEKECGKEEMKVLHDSKGKIMAINKSMDPKKADGEFLGIAKFKSDMKKFIESTSKELFKTGNLHYYMESVVEKAINANINIATFDIGDELFIEIDFEEDYQEAKNLFAKYIS